MIILVISLLSVVALQAQNGLAWPINSCNLLASCDSCDQFVDCQWCQLGNDTSRTFCAGQTECLTPINESTCSTTDSICAQQDTCLDCLGCHNDTYGWCQLPLSTERSHCTQLDNCPPPWQFYQDTCPRRIDLGDDRNLPDTPPTLITGRCSHLTSCGECQKEYMCEWCPDSPEEPHLGYCLDTSNVEEINVCEQRGSHPTRNCDCKGWSDCDQCQMHGCSWCGNGHNDFCFGLANRSELRRCLDSGDDLILNNCPQGRRPGQNPYHLIKVDEDHLPQVKAIIDKPVNKSNARKILVPSFLGIILVGFSFL